MPKDPTTDRRFGKRPKIWKHGWSETAVYYAWHDMISRCTKPDHAAYPDYGARGITVCARWLESFEAFLEDMGDRPTPKHSLDRRDNDGNYEPGNCRWATVPQQGRNRRSNHMITYRGETRCLTEWAEILGMRWDTLLVRIRNGWTIEDAFTKPVAKPRGRAVSRPKDPD